VQYVCSKKPLTASIQVQVGAASFEVSFSNFQSFATPFTATREIRPLMGEADNLKKSMG
jgi:hypothetical protein